MQTKDRKKERLIIYSTIIGMVVILAVWGLQLRTLFTVTLLDEGEGLSQEYIDTIADLESFQQEFGSRFPEVSENFEAMMEDMRQERTVTVAEQEGQEAEAIESVAQEAAARLQEEAAPEETEEGEEE